jgi:hypothetical protein|tara:strand:+ start:1149 stop:1550 length:402 start_codon:yes stop_codon:yes gene_type:complete
MKIKNIIFSSSLMAVTFISFSVKAELSSWDCYKLEGAKIIAEDGTYLGTLDDSYKSDSIYNDYSDYGNEYNSDSVWNDYSDYGNEYSSQSAMNESASEPPVLLKDGEVVGKLTTNDYEYEGVNPKALKEVCDW